MSGDLVEFLRARLDEDEQVARAATPGPWRWDNEEFKDAPPGVCKHGTEWTDHGPDLVTVAGAGESTATVISAGSYDASSVDISRADADHIARHDPARVLADVESKRALVAFLEPTDAPEGEGRFVAERALLLLALPYADHEDFRQEWKP